MIDFPVGIGRFHKGGPIGIRWRKGGWVSLKGMKKGIWKP